MSHPVVHWEIGGNDVEGLRTFYTELFGWEIKPAGPDSLVDGSDGGIGGGIMQVREGMPRYLTFYVQADDLAGVLSRWDPGVGSFALFQDPEEHTVGLLEELD